MTQRKELLMERFDPGGGSRKTPMKSRDILMPDELYQRLQDEARDRGESLNHVMREAARLYLELPPTPLVAIVHAGEPASCEITEKRLVYCSEVPGGERHAYVKVRGFSMSRLLPDGALALIKTRAPYRDGDVIAVGLPGMDEAESCFKKVKMAPSGMLMLLSDPDPSLADPESFPAICFATPEDCAKDGSYHDDIPKDAIIIDPAEMTVEGVWTGDYIFASRHR